MKNIIRITSNRPPVVEFDNKAWAAYVRFGKGSVHKTVEIPSSNQTITIDFDRNGKVIGVELIGVQGFAIKCLLKLVPQIQVPDALLARVRYVSAAKASSQLRKSQELAYA